MSTAVVISVSVFRECTNSSSSSPVISTGPNVTEGMEGSPVLLPGSEGGWEMVIMEDIDAGRPVSAQSPLRAALKNGDAQYKTSLWALNGLICNYASEQYATPYQKVVDSTIIFTVPGNGLSLVNVSCMSMEESSSDSLASGAISTSCSRAVQGGEPADLKTPVAAAWVSVAMLREVDGL